MLVNIYKFMKNFSETIHEVKKTFDSGNLLSSEINKYLSKINNVLPKLVKFAIHLTQKYDIKDRESLEEIRTANSSKLSKIADANNISKEEAMDLQKVLKDLKDDIKLMPQYQTEKEREAVMNGKVDIKDLTIDLDTPQGRNHVAKMYMPMIYKIVNAYVGKSRLSKQELISAALAGLTDAMNDWKKGADDTEKHVSFKTYAAYRAKFNILADMDEYSHHLSGTNWYAVKKYGAGLLDATSIDGMGRNDDGEISQDHLTALGAEDPDVNLTAPEEKQWDNLFKLIEDNFKRRDVDVFYRYFGLNGYKREKSKDIAKSLGMSEGNIRNSILNKMILFLKKDRKASNILQNIQDLYTESLMVDMLDMDSNSIMETLANDDVFLLLEELNRWNNKSLFVITVQNAIDKLSDQDKDIIKNILESDFGYLDDNYKKYKKILIQFLSIINPTDNMHRKTDVDIINNTVELQDACKKFKIKNEIKY